MINGICVAKERSHSKDHAKELAAEQALRELSVAHSIFDLGVFQ